MQVFKMFFKVLNRYKGQMIMYMCIFCSLLTIFIKSNSGSKANEYADEKCKFAVFDYDGSTASKALISYLEGTNVRVDKKDGIKDEKISMQNALYNRDADVILRIPEGFEEKLVSGEAAGLIDAITIPGTKNSMLIESDLDGFINMTGMYIKAGYDMATATERACTALAETAEVSLPDGENVSKHSNLYTFFSYLGWVMVCMIITGITLVLQVFERKELKDRIECSSYNFLNFNKEVVLGMAATGALICGVFLTVSLILLNGQIFSEKGGMYILNMLCYAAVCMAIAFLISKLTAKKEVVSMIANVVSLGMAFLCGIFVPVDFLSDGVIKIAHFLPAYWYNQAAINIDFHLDEKAGSIFSAMGIQILFAIAILIAGMVADRRKRA